MTERKVKLDRANKSILLRALGDVYYGQRARGGSAEETGRLILRVNEGGYTDAVDDALTRLLHAHTPLFIW